MKISCQIEIEAPQETVFYWIEDPSRAMKWMTSVTHTEIIDQKPDLIGTTFREYVEENGSGTEMEGVITDFVPNQRIAFHLEGGYNAVDVDFTLQSREGITQLTQRADVRFKGKLRVLSLFFGPTFKRKITSQMEQEFSTLKALCERDNECR
jgi:uncharacterized protein YndB with AHSA1/START domain